MKNNKLESPYKVVIYFKNGNDTFKRDDDALLNWQISFLMREDSHKIDMFFDQIEKQKIPNLFEITHYDANILAGEANFHLFPHEVLGEYFLEQIKEILDVPQKEIRILYKGCKSNFSELKLENLE